MKEYLVYTYDHDFDVRPIPGTSYASHFFIPRNLHVFFASLTQFVHTDVPAARHHKPLAIIAEPTMFLKKFDANTLGRDFVVGDIHGCFSKLCSTLDALSFDIRKDRLFSVGDLVDRGPQSHLALLWLMKPWFHAVRGNHEDMAIRAARGTINQANYMANGGAWFYALRDGQARQFELAFDALPFAIEIAGSVGIVHAEVPDNDWNRIRFLDERWPQMSNNKRHDVTEQLMWAREKIATRNDAVVRNIDRVFVGHTPVSMPVRLGNVQYIDTGAVFGRDFTVCQL